MMKMPKKDLDPTQAEAIREAASSLAGKSEGELLDALKTATAQERAAGQLTNEQMDDVFNTIVPLLSPSQRQKMEGIFAQLKS